MSRKRSGRMTLENRSGFFTYIFVVNFAAFGKISKILASVFLEASINLKVPFLAIKMQKN
jgi:hypothetical protein